MTPEDIQDMEAGRELDLLIAERVMGKDNQAMQFVPMRYSTDISAAWQVVEKLRETGSHRIELELEAGKWRCNFRPWSLKYKQFAETAPLAICRAALLAVSQQEGK